MSADDDAPGKEKQPQDDFSTPDSSAFRTKADAELYAERQHMLKAGRVGRIAYELSGLVLRLTGRGPFSRDGAWNW